MYGFNLSNGLSDQVKLIKGDIVENMKILKIKI